jgi:hypothetical protein
VTPRPASAAADSTRSADCSNEDTQPCSPEPDRPNPAGDDLWTAGRAVDSSR